MNKLYTTKDFGDSVKDIDDLKGIVVGYFAKFGNVDSDGDMIMPGAFKKSIEENGPGSENARIKHLKFHDTRFAPGVLQELSEDKEGLRFVSKLSSSTLGRDTLHEYKDGIITEHSIGFNTLQSDNSEDFQKIVEVKLWEGSSLVAWGANQATPTVSVKSMTKQDATDHIEKITKALRGGKYSDEGFVNLEIQLEQLKSYLYRLEESPVPGTQKADAVPSDTEDNLNSLLGTFEKSLKL